MRLPLLLSYIIDLSFILPKRFGPDRIQETPFQKHNREPVRLSAVEHDEQRLGWNEARHFKANRNQYSYIGFVVVVGAAAAGAERKSSHNLVPYQMEWGDELSSSQNIPSSFSLRNIINRYMFIRYLDNNCWKGDTPSYIHGVAYALTFAALHGPNGADGMECGQTKVFLRVRNSIRRKAEFSPKNFQY